MKTVTLTRLTNLPVILMLCCICVLVLTSTVSSEAPKNLRSDKAEEAVRMFDVGLGPHTLKVQAGERSKPYTNLQDGHVMSMQYVGDERLRAALASGAQSRALAVADLDADGAPDLIAGYAAGGVGVVTIQRGNIDAYAPKDDAVFVRMQQGYNPDSVLPVAETFEVPESADYIATGDFNGDGLKDVAIGAHLGGLYLLAGDGKAGLNAPVRINVGGPVTALAAGRLTADGQTQLAVGVAGRNALEIYGGSSGELSNIATYDLAGEPVAIQFEQLDDDPFGDLAVAAGHQLTIVHGWFGQAPPDNRAERLGLPFGAEGLAIGNFVWDREARVEMAVLGDDGNLRVLEQGAIDKRPYNEDELRLRREARANSKGKANLNPDLQFVPRWEPGKGKGWNVPRAFGAKRAITAGVVSQARLVRSNIGRQETDEVVVVDGGQNALNLVRQGNAGATQGVVAESVDGDVTTDSLNTTETPAAVLGMPAKVNGSSDLVFLAATQSAPNIVPLAPTSITVDTTTDNAALSACTAAAGDCSLRGAVAFANIAANSPATINIPAGTYSLTIPAGAIEFGGAAICSHPEAGDLDINLNTTVMGAGAASTIIQQTQTQDRVLCLNPQVIAGRTYSISGVTVTGGREPSKYGGAGLVGGARNDSTTISSSIFTDNRAWDSGACPACTGFGSGGGAIKIEGGTLNLTNCTIGTDTLPGTTNPLAPANITLANSGGSGGGVNYSPGAPLGCSMATPCTGDLNLTGSTIKTNTAFSIASGGGGLDLYQHNLGTGNFIIGTTTITGNRATGGGTPNVGGGGGIIVESGPLTINNGVSITNNIANGNGGGMQITGGSVAFNSTSGAITFSGNTANAAGAVGSGIAANSNVSVTGTLLSITNDVDVQDNCAWTNNAGSAVAIANLRLADISGGGNVGTYTANNSTTTLSGNFSLSGGTFLGSSGTVNIGGNFTFSSGAFTANTSTFNFNGASAQSINGPSSPTFFNLTINNASGVNWGVSGTVAGTLNLTSGVLGVGTNTLTLTGPVSFTSGTIGSSATGTVNYTQSAANQNVAPGSYGNLFFNNFVKVLPNGSTVNIAGTFTPGTAAPTTTGSTVNFNGAGVQTVPAINYNNLTISGNRGGATVTLGAGTIGVAGVFNPSATNVVYVKTGNTFDFNAAGAQTIPAFDYNNLTSSNTGARTLANTGTIGIAGVFTQGTNTYTITGSTINFNGAAGQTIPAFNYNNLTSSNTGTRTLAGAGTIGVAGTFTPGTNTYTITGSTVDFNGSGAQTIPAFNYNHLTSSNTGARTLANSGTIGVAGNFTPGTNAYTITGSTIDFNGTVPQAIPAFNYNNLTSSNTGARTLANSGTIGIAGAFTPGTNAYTITGSTIDFNGSGAQTIPAFNYNNLTSSNTGARTLANSGTIAVATLFTPGSNTYAITGSTVSFNGPMAQAVPQFNFNNLTIANTHGANLVTLANGGTIGIAGTFTPGTSTFVITGNTIDFNGSGAQTIPAFNYNNLTSSNAGARTLANAGTIGIAGVFTPGTNTYTITGSTINFNGAGAQSLPGFNYNNLTSSGAAAARTLDPVNPIRIAGVFTPGTDVYTVTGSTIEYNGGAAQSLPGTFTPYNNLTFNNPTTVTGGPATLDVNGNLTITQGTFAAGASLTITVAGNWINNGGSFAPGAGIVTFDGGAGQAIGGTTATTFNNLTNGNASGLAMNFDNTVNGILALTSSDITVAATKTLTQPLAGSSTGTFDVNGRVQRNGFVTGGAALSFGNPLNTIQVTAGVAPANIVVDLARTVPQGAIGFPTAVQRTYTITPSAAGFTGTLRLHYLDSELNGNVEGPAFIFRRFNGTGWAPVLPTSSDFAANWLEATGVTQFSPWTLNSTFTPTASNTVVTGRIVDNSGAPVEGAVVRLAGTQNRKLITDANGVYRFENVDTNGFYTVTPSRANYSFTPSSRSFSQLGETTQAAFGATLLTSAVVNPLDTPEYFVRQHYVDFLNREPDEAGFNFWSDQIIECGTDQNCIERRRENVSAAYFLSIEFQATGGLVDGLYRATYGVRPNFAEFMPDTRAVAQGVVVGQEGWEAKLQANREAFVAAFVNRPAFHAMFDSMDNSLFVDTLISHTGVTFTGAERDALVGGLTAGTSTRADVLRSIAENQGFINAKFNDAFVMMEYFGYLRRDADASGFAFWLNKLNEFGGNFEQAEMVKAFIVSSEYRGRFPR